jgi:hypothetical protein
MTNASFELQGRRFLAPAIQMGVCQDGEDRLIAAVFTGAPTRHGDDVHEASMEPECVDLTFARSGRMPLLWDHFRTLDNLLGGVIAAWLEEGALHIVARLAHGGESDRAWQLLTSGFALNASWGALHSEAEDIGPSPYGGRTYRLTAWELDEISLVLRGNDPNAAIRVLGKPEGFALLARQTSEIANDERSDVFRRLKVPEWRGWVAGAAVAIADELGVPIGRVARALSRQVDRQVVELIAGAAPDAPSQVPRAAGGDVP